MRLLPKTSTYALRAVLYLTSVEHEQKYVRSVYGPIAVMSRHDLFVSIGFKYVKSLKLCLRKSAWMNRVEKQKMRD
jgi:hypothetical protein